MRKKIPDISHTYIRYPQTVLFLTPVCNFKT
nr:MAG TPA: hypothetical protein [Caudoviricetes sp.]